MVSSLSLPFLSLYIPFLSLFTPFIYPFSPLFSPLSLPFFNPVLAFPIEVVLGLFEHELLILVDEQLDGSGAHAEGIVRLASDLVAVVESRTDMVDVPRTDHGHIVQAQRTIVLDVDIDDWGIETTGRDVGITDAREVTTEGLAPILKVLDIRTMPGSLHHVDLAEADRHLADVFELDFLLHKSLFDLEHSVIDLDIALEVREFVELIVLAFLVQTHALELASLGVDGDDERLEHQFALLSC